MSDAEPPVVAVEDAPADGAQDADAAPVDDKPDAAPGAAPAKPTVDEDSDSDSSVSSDSSSSSSSSSSDSSSSDSESDPEFQDPGQKKAAKRSRAKKGKPAAKPKAKAAPGIRRASTRKKVSTGYMEAMKLRVDADGNPLEAEEGAPEEEDTKPKKKKRRKDVTLEEKEAYVQSLLNDMMDAADKDRVAFSNGKPGLHKLSMLKRVREDLLKTDLHETLLSGKRDTGGSAARNILQMLQIWLEPVDGTSLPPLQLRTTVYKCVDQLPVNKHDLENSSIGKLLHEISNHRDETHANKDFLKRIVQKWVRLVLNKQDRPTMLDDYYEESGVPRKTRGAGAGSNAPKSLGAALKRGSTNTLVAKETGPVMNTLHARIPEAMTFNFTRSVSGRSVEPLSNPKSKEPTSAIGRLQQALKNKKRAASQRRKKS